MIVPDGVDIKNDTLEQIMVALVKAGYEKEAARAVAKILKGKGSKKGSVL